MLFVALLLAGILSLGMTRYFLATSRVWRDGLLVVGFGALAVFSFPSFHIGMTGRISAVFQSLPFMMAWPIIVAGVGAGVLVGLLGRWLVPRGPRWMGRIGVPIVALMLGAVFYVGLLVLFLVAGEGH